MRLPVVLGLSGGLVVLAACVTDEAKDGEPVQAVAEPQVAAAIVQPQLQPTPQLSPRERLRKAISLLEVGEAAQARVELAAYMQEVPNSKLARNLIQQIDTDPRELFGEASYAHAMQPGETLSIVAKRSLGDAMLFHALARYNGIANPSAIKAGQVIRIPGAAPQADGGSRAEPRTVAVSPGEALEIKPEADRLQDLLTTARGLSRQGDYRGAAALYEEGLVEFPDYAGLRKPAPGGGGALRGRFGRISGLCRSEETGRGQLCRLCR